MARSARLRASRVAAGLCLAAALASAAAAQESQGGGAPAAPRAVEDAKSAESAAKAELTRKVREILATFDGAMGISSSDRRLAELRAFGRPVIPVLLAEYGTASPRTAGYRWTAIAWALDGLVTESDVPLLAPLLAAGHCDLARALTNFRCDAVRDALVASMDAGFASHEVLRALEGYPADAEVTAALVRWFARPSAASTWGSGAVATALAERGAVEAVPALLATLRADVEAPDQTGIAAALARFGRREGVERLVEIVRASPAATYPAHEAAQSLNAVVGRRIYTGEFSPAGFTGDYEAAAKELLAWWDGAKDRLRWDARGGRWTTEPEGAGFAWPESPPDVAEQVRAILAGVPLRSELRIVLSEAARDPRGRRRTGDAEALEALGHSAVPAIAQELRREALRGGERWASPRAQVAGAALVLLCRRSDVPLLLALVAEGHLEAVRALGAVAVTDDLRVRDALLALVRSGSANSSVVEALVPWRDDAATWDAVGAALRVDVRNVALDQFLAESGSEAALPLARSIVASKDTAPRLRLFALTAMARNGDAACVEPLLAFVEKDPGAQDGPNRTWTSTTGDEAGQVLDSIVGERIHGNPDAAPRFRAWWTAHRTALRFDRSRRVWTTDPRPVIEEDPPAVDPRMAARVAEVLAIARQDTTHWGFDDRHALRLAALGRDAIPALVTEMRRALPWDSGSARDAAAHCGEALRRLFGDEDRALAVSLLREGRLDVAEYFDEHVSPEGQDALLDVVRRGFVVSEVTNALRPYAPDPLVHDTLLAWFRRQPDPGEAGDQIAYAISRATTGGKRLALRDIADESLPAALRTQVAVWLVRDGVAEAIPFLIAAYEDPAGLDAQGDWWVADCLNETAGQSWAAIPEHPPIRIRGLPNDLGGGDGDDAPQRGAARADAARRFRSWWDANRDRLRFDRTTEKWKTPPVKED